jgi:VIT1/CCC1 family predicted Fe2+/Mn2+ transporter
MFLIVFGMFGGGAIARSILLAGITGAIAGAISMGLGEYIATKSQLEIMVSDISRERCVYEFRVIFCISLYLMLWPHA